MRGTKEGRRGGGREERRGGGEERGGGEYHIGEVNGVIKIKYDQEDDRSDEGMVNVRVRVMGSEMKGGETYVNRRFSTN